MLGETFGGPAGLLAERYADELAPTTTEEAPSKGLQRAYRAARARGDRWSGGVLYERWTAQKCAEGDRPDELRRYAGTPTERFWACVIEGVDGHLVWDGRRNSRNVPITVSPSGKSNNSMSAQRFAWRLKHGELPNRWDVWSVCGAKHCVNVDHLTAGWLPRGWRAQLSDEQCITAIQVAAARLGRTPTIREYDAQRSRTDALTGRGLELRFGGWPNAMRAAGLEPLPRGAKHGRTDEEVIAHVRDLAARLGRCPSRRLWTNDGGEGNLDRRFGMGWNDVWRMVGVD
jgi:hypothetical protein